MANRMSTESSSPEDGRRTGRARWSLGLLLVVLAVALAAAQLGWVTPIDPIRATAQTNQPLLLWVAGDYGVATDRIDGNSSAQGNTLTLNSLQSSANATATWSISFPEAYDVEGRTLDFTMWIPATMEFVHNNTPLRCSVEGHSFSFQPTYPESIFGLSGFVYGPAPNQTQRLPGLFAGFLGGDRYVPLSSSVTSVNATVHFELTVPAAAQAIVPNVVFSAAPVASSASGSAGAERGWLMLPILGVGIAAFLWALRKLNVLQVATTFAVGIGLRIAIAPVFLHTDVVTLTQYPVLFYPYGIANLESFIYGPTWFLSLIAPAAPFYAAGVTPSTDALNLVFKLTPIAFDGLTYLVLLRLLTSLRDERTAFRWATFGWLFNPFVIYFSAVHGLDESAVAFFLVLTVYLVQKARWNRASIGETLAVLTLYPAAFALPPLLALKKRPLRFVVLALVLPFGLMAALFLAVYRSLAPAIAYLGVLVGGTSAQTLPTYGSIASAQSPWLLLWRGFGFVPSPLDGLAIVSITCLVLVLVRRPILPQALPAAVTVALLVFYLTYQSFFVQLLIWVLPVMLILLFLRPGAADRGLGLLLGLSVLALVMNALAPPLPYVIAILSMALFALLAVPVMTLVPDPSKWASPRLEHGIEATALLLALVLLVMTGVLRPFREDLVALMVLVSAGQAIVVVSGYMETRFARHETVLPLVSIVTAAGALGYLFAAFNWGTLVLSEGLLAIAVLVTLNSLRRVTWLTHRWVGADV